MQYFKSNPFLTSMKSIMRIILILKTLNLHAHNIVNNFQHFILACTVCPSYPNDILLFIIILKCIFSQRIPYFPNRIIRPFETFVKKIAHIFCHLRFLCEKQQQQHQKVCCRISNHVSFSHASSNYV